VGTSLLCFRLADQAQPRIEANAELLGAFLSLKEVLDISRDWEDKEIKGPP
jgi:hypothetical protein